MVASLRLGVCCSLQFPVALQMLDLREEGTLGTASGSLIGSVLESSYVPSRCKERQSKLGAGKKESVSRFGQFSLTSSGLCPSGCVHVVVSAHPQDNVSGLLQAIQRGALVASLQCFEGQKQRPKITSGKSWATFRGACSNLQKVFVPTCFCRNMDPIFANCSF